MYTLDDINKIMAESPESVVGDAATHYVSGSGDAWYFDPQSRRMQRVERGVNFVANAEYADKKGRLLAYFFDGKILLIPRDEAIELGYN